MDLKISIFFSPDTELVDWLGNYANGRIIIDIGAGTHFHLTKMLYGRGFRKLVAMEQMATYEDFNNAKIQLKETAGIPFHFMPGVAQQYGDLFKGGYQKPLMIFARPCHSTFVFECLNLKGEDVEALYITVPENLGKFNDLGNWKAKVKLVEHKGKSKDNELIYSII